MLRIGLTGGIGSGKSYVAGVFKELGVPIYHADAEARRIMETDDIVKEKIILLFGKEAFAEGKLDRKHLASRVFTDKNMLNALNEIVHPAVHQDFYTWSEELIAEPYVIEEAAILFESGGHRQMDYNVIVSAEESTRINRVMKRDGVSEEDVRMRIAAQMSAAEKEKLADYIIYNDIGSMILPQIVDLHNTFLT